MNAGHGAKNLHYDGRGRVTDGDLGPAWRSKNVAYQETLNMLLRYARHDAIPILLEGPSGTGKTSMAREIHAVSPRSGKVFKELTLSSMEDSLSGSDLFGHVAGAFTDARHTRTGAFISASGGTLFLDEVGKASQRLQAKLLGSVERGVVVQQGSDREVRVNVRVVSATNISLSDLVRRDSFLPDLAARLAMFRVELPALSERREDIRDLTLQLLARYAPNFGFSSLPTVDESLFEALENAEWPLNIRQLGAVIQRILLVTSSCNSDHLTLAHCIGDLAYLRGADGRRPISRETTITDVRQKMRPEESRAALAKRLGISEATLYRRLREEESARRQD